MILQRRLPCFNFQEEAFLILAKNPARAIFSLSRPCAVDPNLDRVESLKCAPSFGKERLKRVSDGHFKHIGLYIHQRAQRTSHVILLYFGVCIFVLCICFFNQFFKGVYLVFFDVYLVFGRCVFEGYESDILGCVFVI